MPLYDLRSPLGVAPADLTPESELLAVVQPRGAAATNAGAGQGQAGVAASLQHRPAAGPPPPLSLLAQQRFLETRRWGWQGGAVWCHCAAL